MATLLLFFASGLTRRVFVKILLPTSSSPLASMVCGDDYEVSLLAIGLLNVTETTKMIDRHGIHW
jgi:hypothetical protein